MRVFAPCVYLKAMFGWSGRLPAAKFDNPLIDCKYIALAGSAGSVINYVSAILKSCVVSITQLVCNG
jgi:hypothetical protein